MSALHECTREESANGEFKNAVSVRIALKQDSREGNVALNARFNARHMYRR